MILSFRVDFEQTQKIKKIHGNLSTKYWNQTRKEHIDIDMRLRRPQNLLRIELTYEFKKFPIENS